MRLNINLWTKVITLGVIITFLIFGQFSQGYTSSNFDFSLEIDNNILIIQVGHSNTSMVSIESLSNESENVSLSGVWIGNQPQNISVNMSTIYGYTPFSSNITFTLSGSNMGNFIYQLTAEGNSSSHSTNILVNATYWKNLTIQTNKNNYSSGEQIQISGNITTNPSSNTIFSNDVTITLEYGNWKRYLSTSMQNNSYNCTYNISYGDPKGTWNVTARTTDDYGTVVSILKNISVTLPSDTVRYKVVWFSPPEEAIYQRGTIFDISVFVTEDNTGVRNATTNCILPNIEIINLTEITQGYYKGSFKIPWDGELGVWVLSLESTTGSGSSLNAGGSNISITIKPATLGLDLIKPSKVNFRVGEPIEIEINLSYSDNTDVENADVVAQILDENLSFIKQNNGTYFLDYTIPNIEKGSFIIEISASDEFDNNASLSMIINIIYEEQFIFPLDTIVGTIVAILIIGFVTYYIRKRFSSEHFHDVKREIEEIERLQNEAVAKYYKKGSISRKTYDLLRKEYTERLAELKKEEEKLKK